MAQFTAAVIDPDLNLGHWQAENAESTGRREPVVLFLACRFARQQGAVGRMVRQVFAALQRGLQHRASHGPECCVGCGWLVVEQRTGIWAQTMLENATAAIVMRCLLRMGMAPDVAVVLCPDAHGLGGLGAGCCLACRSSHSSTSSPMA